MRISTIRVSQEAKRIAQEDNLTNFKAYPSWVHGFMKRNNLSVRSSTSIGQKLPSAWEAKVKNFQLYLNENLCGVDLQHFGNMDEVPVSFDMPASRTVTLKGAKEVSIATTGHEKSNFTVVLCITACGNKLPPMIIFKRKTVPKGCDSKGIIVTANEKGWMNSEVMKLWINEVWRKRKQSFFNPKSLLLLDSCRAHITPEIKTIVSKYSRMAVIPGGLTKNLQPLDIAVNKPFKDNMRTIWENWMMAGIHEYSKTGKIKRPSYKDIVGWVSESWDAVSENSVKNGFLKARGHKIQNFEDNSGKIAKVEINTNEVPKEILEVMKSFNVDSNEEFIGFESHYDQ